ncbi:hypothetical protein Y032_0113g401 [Ancylostoma ceylanicum]|uniref:Uncharacterized protein n=1 Tax=Ancylostoma ceylanicum TaxID=53326 RepID=A0A016TDT0_9BILA|nr:hypothetical protein Y032_0113g401 [Ancylostoma ceylanicum]
MCSQDLQSSVMMENPCLDYQRNASPWYIVFIRFSYPSGLKIRGAREFQVLLASSRLPKVCQRLKGRGPPHFYG